MLPKAIVLDDEELVRVVVCQLLSDRGYDVTACSEPLLCPLLTDGRCKCRPGEACADVLITDVNMPGMSGLDFVERLMRAGCRIPRKAVMSGSWSPEERARAEQMGCTVIEKPIRVEELDSWLAEPEPAVASS